MLADNYVRRAVVTRVVDGDTFYAEVDLGYHVSTLECFRLLGVNAPEMTGVDKPNGLISKAFVVDEIENKQVSIRSVKTDAFKRWLGEVEYVNEDGIEVNLAVELLERGLAEVYQSK